MADLLNLEVDLLFFDTTSTYFERDEEDEDWPSAVWSLQGSPAGSSADCHWSCGDEGGHPGEVLDHAGKHVGHEDGGDGQE